MWPLSLIAAGAALLTFVVAQTPQIAFTSVPAVVVAGQTYNITWGGGDGTSYVTITLRKGDPSNLQTIATLTGSATGYYYLWTVSDSLATASDYALQITQGETDINYSGLFSLVGGTGSSSVAVPTTLTGNVANTVNMTSSGNAVGTGTAMSRNTTFSSPTLSPTSSASSGPASVSATATSTSASASVAQSTTAQASRAGALNVAYSAALLITAVAATFVLF